MEDHDDFAFEPVPGLPEKLPRGETMIWQGSPEWRALAISAFRIRPVGAYFGLLLAWELASAWRSGASVSDMLALSTWIVGLSAAAIGILCGLAYFYARGTIYTLTTKRIVIRTGLALPITLNLPLSLIDTAAVGASTLGTKGITLAVAKPNRVAWLVAVAERAALDLHQPAADAALPDRRGRRLPRCWRKRCSKPMPAPRWQPARARRAAANTAIVDAFGRDRGGLRRHGDGTDLDRPEPQAGHGLRRADHGRRRARLRRSARARPPRSSTRPMCARNWR